MKLTAAEKAIFKRFGRKGGKARAKNLTPDQRKKSASNAAVARWTRVRAAQSEE